MVTGQCRVVLCSLCYVPVPNGSVLTTLCTCSPSFHRTQCFVVNDIHSQKKSKRRYDLVGNLWDRQILMLLRRPSVGIGVMICTVIQGGKILVTGVLCHIVHIFCCC